MTTRKTNADRYNEVIAHLTALREAALEGSNERLQWEIALDSVLAARQFGEGQNLRGLATARSAAAKVAGH